MNLTNRHSCRFLNRILTLMNLFPNHFYASMERSHKYPLNAFLWALSYINGHFCYAYKIGIITNGLGIVRHLEFYNKDFLVPHSEVVPNKKSASPDEDNSIHDARLLLPTLIDFFQAHPLINPKSFLGDTAFDSVSLYEQLLSDDAFGKTNISLKPLFL